MKIIIHQINLSLILFLTVNVIFSQSYYPYFSNQKWGIVDSDGNITLPPSYEQIDIFKNNSFNSFTTFKSDNKVGIISGNGEIVIPLTSHRINYDHNGSYAWYYDNPKEEGLHLYSLKKKVKLEYYEGLKVESVVGNESAFAILKNPGNNKKLLLDIHGEIIREIDQDHVIRIEFDEMKCPLIVEVKPPSQIISTFLCNGKNTTRNEFIINNKIQENNEQEFVFGDAGFQNNSHMTEAQLAKLFPDYKHSEICSNYFSSLYESIIVVKDNLYGLGSIYGRLVLPCNFDNLSCEKGYILGQKDNKKGLFTNYGKVIFNLNFKEITILDKIEFNLIQLETFDGSKYYGSSTGKIFCPKSLTLK